MDAIRPPASFSELSFYTAHFMDLALWEPIIVEVAAHNNYKSLRILPGLQGTFPTFIVELKSPAGYHPRGSIVVKFFGPLFEGQASYQVELAMSTFLSQQSLSLHTPLILAEGQLNDEWSYLIFEHIPGVSIGQVRDELPEGAWEATARQVGRYMRELHQLTASLQPVITNPAGELSWESYTSLLEIQRKNCLSNHKQWHDLPAHFLSQLPGFIPPIDQLIDLDSTPHLIHADLTGDHLLGRLFEIQLQPQITQKGGIYQLPVAQGSVARTVKDWETLAIIDWGDCRVGNILYELVALHCDMFRADKRLLRLCLEAYGLPVFYQQEFARKALSTMLLHQFPMPASIYAPHQDVRTLVELADRIFAI